LTIDYWPLNLKSNYFVTLNFFHTMSKFQNYKHIFHHGFKWLVFTLLKTLYNQISYKVSPKVIPCSIKIENQLETMDSFAFFWYSPNINQNSSLVLHQGLMLITHYCPPFSRLLFLNNFKVFWSFWKRLVFSTKPTK
jgi:hypothetical protein